VKLKRSRVLALSIFGILAFAALATVWLRAARRSQSADQDIPVAAVQRGVMSLDVYGTGELQASHMQMLTAPPIGGDALEITKLVPTGQLVKKGDIVVEFDPSGQQFKLEQSRSDLEQAQQEIIKAQADAAVLSAKDKVGLLKAHYDVRKAELDVQKDELLSRIDAQKNQLALDQANRALAELEEDVKSHAQSGQADVYLAREKYNKAKLAMDTAQQNLQKMRVVAPMDGLVSIRKNMFAAGGIYFTGMTLPEFRAGDQVQPGSSIAQIVDPMEMNLLAHISEMNRSNLRPGQAVEVRSYAMPDKVFRGTVKSVAGMTSQSFVFDSTAGGTFDATVTVPNLDSHLRPGLTADLRFDGATQKDVLFVPRIAILVKEGKHIVYVQTGSGYRQHEVKVLNENESSSAIAGIAEGTLVALRDPAAPVRTPASAAGASGGIL
jgi:multidrug resistance efflux pump